MILSVINSCYTAPVSLFKNIISYFAKPVKQLLIDTFVPIPGHYNQVKVYVIAAVSISLITGHIYCSFLSDN